MNHRKVEMIEIQKVTTKPNKKRMTIYKNEHNPLIFQKNKHFFTQQTGLISQGEYYHNKKHVVLE